MAIMGGFIGISFALAMGLGPVIGGYAGVPALFLYYYDFIFDCYFYIG